jgi:hypothetical protein
MRTVTRYRALKQPVFDTALRTAIINITQAMQAA